MSEIIDENIEETMEEAPLKDDKGKKKKFSFDLKASKKFLISGGAAILLLLGVGGYYFLYMKPASVSQSKNYAKKQQPVKPLASGFDNIEKQKQGAMEENPFKVIEDNTPNVAENNADTNPFAVEHPAVDTTTPVVETQPVVAKDEVKQEVADQVNKVLKQDDNSDKVMNLKEVSDQATQAINAQQAAIDAVIGDANEDVDVFLLRYGSAIEDDKMTDKMDASIRKLKKASDTLAALTEYQQQLSLWKEQVRLQSGAMSEAETKLQSKIDELSSSVDRMRSENARLKSDIINSVNTYQAQNSENAKRIDASTGFVGHADNDTIALAANYMGKIYSQNVYRIGSSYILEEQSDDGEINTYVKGQFYRGGMIEDIQPDMLKMKFGKTTKLVTLNMANNGKISYNNVKIDLGGGSSKVENLEKVDDSKNTVQDYSSITSQRNRQNEQQAPSNINRFFSGE